MKVLDFGLAKPFATAALGDAASAMDSPTLTVHATQMGVVLGTLEIGSPGDVLTLPPGATFADVTPDGRQFLLGRRAVGRPEAPCAAPDDGTSPDTAHLHAVSSRSRIRRCH